MSSLFEQLGRLVESIWQQFDGVIIPLWRVEDSLVAIYEELASLRKQLESLQTLENVNSDERSAFLCQIQDRLHEIENENLIDGKFIPPNYRKDRHNTKIPSGQAIVMTLLQKCYRLVRVIQETETSVVSPSLYPLESKLDKIIFDLEIILGSYINDEPVDPLELRMIQEHVLAIDRIQIEGKFLDSEGVIPEGQAIIREKLEQAFDLIHECIVNQPELNNTDDSILSSLNSTVTDARETLVSYATGISDVSLATVHSVYSTLRDGTTYVRESILAPLYVADNARSKMVNALRSGLGYSSVLLAKLEPVEESLRFVEADLVSIRMRLKKLRNQRVAYKIRKMTNDGVSAVLMDAIVDDIPPEGGENKPASMETKSFRRTLEDLQNELDAIDGKRLDGKFLDSQGNVVKGQAYLQSLLDECYCLIFELLDFDDETEW
ncbi:hypothetical protein HK096_010340 [Nowakowskiella sp. JEL0078]|nr:hypothetical protein HK096_010340 [Nowakowskiella sp. JEL0078]